MAQAFRSNRVLLPHPQPATLIQPAALIVDDGVITGIVAHDAVPPEIEVVDFGDHALLPGLIDVHTHINQPGRTEWEGFETATRAAAAGGFVTVVDMPLNCLPETTSVEALEQKRIAAKGLTYIDWLPWGGLVGPGDDSTSNLDDLDPLVEAGAAGFKCFLIYPGCEGLTHLSLAQLRRAAPTLARLGKPLLVHAELEGPIMEASKALYAEDADWPTYATYLASRPDEAELAAIRALIELVREFRFRLHIVHLATAQAVPVLAAAKAEGLPITVETCPHYLCISAEEIADGATQFKCAPPIRRKANQDELWQALRDGVIDLIATDHSPCPPEMKPAGPFDKAWGGIASLSTAVPVIWTEAQKRGFGLQDLVRWFAVAPARLAGLNATHGELAVGRPANFTVFAPESMWTVTERRLHYRHPISPYLGRTLKGEVVATYLRGEPVFTENEFSFAARGRDLSV